MSEKSDHFEQMIARIQELLEGQGVDVKWNEKILDPDNPTQPRQIDVSIRKDSLFNIVECRTHNRTQDVKWIEELIGRRVSLNADTVIAVSDIGFTSGAIKKAAKYGILLYDLLNLSKEQIESWSNAVKVSIFFYRFDEFEISLFFNPTDISNLDSEIVGKELKNYYGLRSILNAPLDIIDNQNLILEENRNKNVSFGVMLKIENFLLQGKVVEGIEVKGKVALEKIDLNVPTAIAFGVPNTNIKERNVYIQKFNLGQTEIIHHNKNLSVSLDLSKLDVPQFWQFRYIKINASDENSIEKLEIIDPEKINMKVGKCIVNLLTRIE